LRDKTLTLTVTNPDFQNAQETEIALRGAGVKEVQVTTLTHKDFHAHNSFENPRVIEPQAGKATISGGTIRCSFAPASVARLQITLA
jgi:alpha-N-arabinofuranosidase